MNYEGGKVFDMDLNKFLHKVTKKFKQNRDRSMASAENSIGSNDSAHTGSPERSFIGMKESVMQTLDAANMNSRASPKMKSGHKNNSVNMRDLGSNAKKGRNMKSNTNH